MASKHSKEEWSGITAQVRFPDRPVWSFVGRGHDWRSLCPLRVESGGKMVKRVAVENPLSRVGHTHISSHTSSHITTFLEPPVLQSSYPVTAVCSGHAPNIRGPSVWERH